MKTEKINGLLANILIYLIAFVVGFIPFYFIKNILLASFVLTVTATMVVYLFSLCFKNTSIYDPYWSVAPLVILLMIYFRHSFWNVNSIIILSIVAIWSLRLTINWAITYKGLNPKYEDWRYAQFRQEQKPIVFHLINFFGLQFIPTLVVFAAMVPVILLSHQTVFNYWSIIGYAIALSGPILEFIADHQVHKFIKQTNDHSLVCNIGLWKYSRHPNYLGENLFWFGLFVAFIVTYPSLFYYGLGWICMPLLFICISIPMMEKHNIERRPAYLEYMKQTSMFFILPRRK